jgi:hypothetical protein
MPANQGHRACDCSVRDAVAWRLDDLVTAEVERLLKQVSDAAFSVDAAFSPTEFKNRVTRYESVSEPLGRVAGVLGRWGDGSELLLMIDLLKALYAEAEKDRNGGTVWLNLRGYPTVLVFTAYATGMTRSQRWSDLHALFVAH